MRSTLILTAIVIAVLTASFGNASAVIAQDISPAATSIGAVKRGGPFINFTDGQPLPGDTGSLAAGGAEAPVALASADFDGDGTADLAVAYRTANGGLVTVRRGNVESVFPANQDASPTPFLNKEKTFELPFAPDFLAAGDFNADRKQDLLAAKRGMNSLLLLAGNGTADFAEPRTIQLTGAITSFAAGEMNNFDNLTDIAIGITEKNRSKVLIFQSRRSAFGSEPEIVKVRNAVSAMAFGQLDGKGPRDLAAAAGDELIVVRGQVKSDEISAEVGTERITRHKIDFWVSALAIGDFTGGSENEIAALSQDGAIKVSGSDLKGGFTAVGSQTVGTGSNSLLLAAKVSTGVKADLIFGGSNQIHFARADGSGDLSLAATLDAFDTPVAVLPMRLNKDAISDLVVLHANSLEPSVLMTAPVSVITVNSTSPIRTTGAVNLEQAIEAANSSPGLDEIRFNIADPNTPILVEADLPEITEGVTFDATTQTGYSGEPIIVIEDSEGAVFTVPMLRFAGGNSVLRGFVVTTNSSLLNIVELGGNNNFIEGNFIGTNRQGTATGGDGLNGVSVSSNGNLVGGGVPQARNVISGVAGAPSSTGVSVTGSDNRVEGNYIGTGKTGMQAVANSGVGIWVGSIGTGNVVGGPADGQRNVISGNGLSGLTVNPTPGQFSDAVIENNFIGTNVNGDAALGNGSGGVLLAFSAGNIPATKTVSIFGNLISGNTGDGIYAYNIAVPPELNVSPEQTSAFLWVGSRGPGGFNASPEIANSYLWVGSRGPGGLATSPETVPTGNRIGTNAAGTAALPNTGNGVRLENFPSLIEGNLISGNAANGVSQKWLAADFPAETETSISGNYIGTDITGNNGLGNGANGIAVERGAIGPNSPKTFITASVISGNTGNGIEFVRTGAARPDEAAMPLHGIVDKPSGCFIGTNAAGTSSLGNGGDGISIRSPWVAVGGAAESERNIISGNSRSGIAIEPDSAGATPENVEIENNYIGTNASGDTSIGNGSGGVSISAALPPIDAPAATLYDNVISGNAGDGVFASVTGNSARNNAAPEASSSFFVDLSRRPPGNLNHAANGTVSPGNRIGTNAAGAAALPNTGNGINLVNAPARIEGSIIAGNGVNGIKSLSQPDLFSEIADNHIGVDASGANAIGNSDDGVNIELSGAAPAEIEASKIWDNVISGNGGDGVAVSAENVTWDSFRSAAPEASVAFFVDIAARRSSARSPEAGVLFFVDIAARRSGAASPGTAPTGNRIGTNAAGTSILPNGGDGIKLTASPALVENNLISGNAANGIKKAWLTSNFPADTETRISNNYIGTDITGNGDLGNGASGITVERGAITPNSPKTFITASVISGNTGNGIEFVQTGAARSGEAAMPVNGIFDKPTGCYIGTNAAGTSPLANGGDGISIRSPGVVVGGATAPERNIISGNSGSGINVGPTGNGAMLENIEIENNYIGTDTTGGIDLGNGASGITFNAGDAAQAATSALIWSNVVSGNQGDGVRIFSNAASRQNRSPEAGVLFFVDIAARGAGNLSPNGVPAGNRIGTNAAGTSPLGNGGHGVSIAGVPTKVGGDTTADGNVIAHNGGSGVNLANIGDQTGRPGSPVLNNLIHSNTLMAIDLGGDGLTPNDLLDPDTGPNNLQNYPVLASAFSNGASTTVNGAINTTPNTALNIHFYNLLGGGGGPLGMLAVTSNASGNATFSVTLPVGVTAGSMVSAVATTTDTNPGNENNTSEFSPGVTVFAPTSASVTVTGRILSAEGAVPQAVVSLTDQNGATRTAISNGFGYYRFEDVAVGESYVFNVRSKRHQFAPRIVTVLEEIEDLNFTAQ